LKLRAAERNKVFEISCFSVYCFVDAEDHQLFERTVSVGFNLTLFAFRFLVLSITEKGGRWLLITVTRDRTQVLTIFVH